MVIVLAPLRKHGPNPSYTEDRTLSFDNALAETINGLYKAEVIEHEGPCSGKKDVEMATLNWVHWYISPATAERNFYNADCAANIAAE
jgi:hypothetical protein